MSENPDELPEAAGLGAESDVVAERSGATTERAPRPIPADPPEDQDTRPNAGAEDRAEEQDAERGEEERPDIGPTG